ncbi:HNH endonuclease [Vibrio sp. 16]|uniref:HNH endonuclease n=1 Tax=Vibrio sp. 16 TaxID=391586 RepID=UPI00018F1B84|nr:HNH endonuclease [Vibrio sp. 16]EED25364.1 hypothetical protein VPMS16_2734 [Vibrio sp. 16]CAK4076502.1 HNH endonuclease signature motif containing protein [Vibrio sp. 16]
MKDIGYLVRGSKFYEPIKLVVEEKSEQLLFGSELKIEFEGYAYDQNPIKASITPNVFLANFKSNDVTRFCARLKALATVLRDLGFTGEYVISHLKGVCRFQKIDVNEEVVLQHIHDKVPNSDTTKLALVESRCGQGIYRKKLIELEKRCRVTGVDIPVFLRASHIKPWKMSSDAERLDPNNGLLLAPHVDHLFDGGWITFDEFGNGKCASDEVRQTLSAWNIPLPLKIDPLNEKQSEYMRFHSRFVYQGHDTE